MSTSPITQPGAQKHFSSSILLWMRTDQPRKTGMDYWKGPHSGIISANPGLEEYRQIHLAEDNPGRWPATHGLGRSRSAGLGKYYHATHASSWSTLIASVE